MKSLIKMISLSSPFTELYGMTICLRKSKFFRLGYYYSNFDAEFCSKNYSIWEQTKAHSDWAISIRVPHRRVEVRHDLSRAHFQALNFESAKHHRRIANRPLIINQSAPGAQAQMGAPESPTTTQTYKRPRQPGTRLHAIVMAKVREHWGGRARGGITLSVQEIWLAVGCCDVGDRGGVCALCVVSLHWHGFAGLGG